MKFEKKEKGATHAVLIPMGRHAGDLFNPAALAACVHVTESGSDVGSIRFDIAEGDEARIQMTHVEAHALAHLLSRFETLDAQKLADALLDAAHRARLALGQESTRARLVDIGEQDEAFRRRRIALNLHPDGS